jgi:hypothetical protein
MGHEKSLYQDQIPYKNPYLGQMNYGMYEHIDVDVLALVSVAKHDNLLLFIVVRKRFLFFTFH